MNGRRTFLRQLTTLPLIGGSVALIGQPTATAEPVTVGLLDAYKTWLEFERRSVSWEMAARHDVMPAHLSADRNDRFKHIDRCLSYVGGSAKFHRFDDVHSASSRAALVLSAVGCDWREGRS